MKFIVIDPPTTEGLTALTNFKTDAMWGSYCPSKACQILSSYKLKHDLTGNVPRSSFPSMYSYTSR